MSLEKAREEYKKKYLKYKGVMGVCSKYKTANNPSQKTAQVVLSQWIMVYVDNVYVIDGLPKEFEGYKCEYIVSPNGIEVGCD